MIFLSGRASRTPQRPLIAAKRVPSLASLCLRILARYPDQVPIDFRRSYDPAQSDILDNALKDPLYWVTITQIYDNLPEHLNTLVLPLADIDVPLLQRIQHTPIFSMLTILDLPGCPHLTDSSIVLLSPLHSLVAFDASATSLSSYAIKVLAGTLLWVDDGPLRRGPWPLRILRLRFCNNIDDGVYPHLERFPLLTAIDLRGTDCRPPVDCSFRPCQTRPELFHPASLLVAVESLEGEKLYTSENAFKLVVDTLDHPPIHIAREPPAFAESYTFGAPAPKCKAEERSTRLIPSMRRPNVSLGIPPATGLNANSPTTTSESTPDKFYDHQRICPPPQVTYDPDKNYNAKTYYKWAHLEVIARPADHLDQELALYRTPPPWSALEERSAILLSQTRARPSTEDKDALSVAPVNRTRKSFQIDQARIDALRESASAKRRSSAGTAPIHNLAIHEAPSSLIPKAIQGRNPFRRHSMGGSGSETKALKPISAVEIPILPPDLKAGMIANNRVRSNSTMAAPMIKPRPVAFDSTWSGREQTMLEKKRSRSVERTEVKKKLRIGDGSAWGDEKKGKSVGEGSVRVKKGFDWSSWGTK
ncbi:hypothetical protein DXG01_015744 [Tephrocybe rancida]|nr:hypothetical protein DXG01_015744 [Tephrocybe rancida]